MQKNTVQSSLFKGHRKNINYKMKCFHFTHTGSQVRLY